MDFAKLCGLDNDPLGISATGSDNNKKKSHCFQMLGEWVESHPDRFVIRHNMCSDRTDELVIVFTLVKT